MTRKLKLIVASGVVVAIGTVTGGLAIAGGAIGGDDQQLVGSELERATDAALASTGGGTVGEAEVGDDGAAYEVEVRLPDGSQVEVQIDESFHVVGRETDDDGGADEEKGDD